jgi:predicted GH43/DUF377 family glycosyl hydrolase
MRRFLAISILVMLFLVSTFNSSFAQIPWTKDARNPIMSGGADGTWSRHVFTPSVLYNPDSTRYEMWFGTSTNGGYPYHVGFANSDDGVNWTQHPDPVLEPKAGTWDASTVLSARVIRENGQYKMWYSGWSPTSKGGIGYATSTDGINWAKDTLNNPVIPVGSADWEAGGQDWFCVLPVQDGGYKMWYNASNASYTKNSIGFATSDDGIVWQRDTLNNPVLRSGTAGQWDEVITNPHVIMLNGEYHMCYEGTQSSWNPRQMGWATSVDGIHWNKYDDSATTSALYSESDPVLKPNPGQWDGNYIEPGALMLEGDSLRLWYSGSLTPVSTNLWRIGHATAPVIPTGLFEIEDVASPDGYVLRQNYPNPFNPSTTIEFTLPKSDFVELKVYNILGKEVATLVSNKLNSGKHTFQFSGQNLASGVYYYQLAAGEFREVKKMILLR